MVYRRCRGAREGCEILRALVTGFLPVRSVGGRAIFRRGSARARDARRFSGPATGTDSSVHDSPAASAGAFSSVIDQRRSYQRTGTARAPWVCWFEGLILDYQFLNTRFSLPT